MNHQLVKLSTTFFYIGKSPFAPGTMASLAGALIAVSLAGHAFLYIVVTAFFTWLGFKTSSQMEDVLNEKDPSCVVIDEIAGVMIAFFLLPITWPVMICAFFLFRAFDMFKIYPANEMEKKGGSAGIMLDDVVAGIYTNLTMHIAIRLAGLV